VTVVNCLGKDQAAHDYAIGLAKAIRDAGRRVVLLSDRYGQASDLTMASDWNDLQRRWQVIGGPEARFIGLASHDDENAAAIINKAHLNYVVTHRRSATWVRQTLRNIRYLVNPSLMSLDRTLLHVPAFIVGSGPSLSRNRQHMAEASKVGVVIGVNGGGQALDVAPHVTLAIESEDTRALLGDTRDSIRAFGICCHPEVLEHGTGPLSPVYISNPSGAVDAFTGVRRLECSVSATTAAINLARTMGCSPIVLVGQDLAFTGGALYAQETGGGTVGEDGTCEWGERQATIPRQNSHLPGFQSLVDLEAWGGGTVQSNNDFRLVTGYLGDAAKHWPACNYELWDCTEGGARKPGWVELPLADAVRVLQHRGLPSPTPEELRTLHGALSPIATRDQLVGFLRAQADLTRAARGRGAILTDLCQRLATEPAGRLPGPVSDLIGWAAKLTEWTDSATSNAMFVALEEFEQSRHLEDEAEERVAERAALAGACMEMDEKLGELETWLTEALAELTAECRSRHTRRWPNA
jgi:hypothetical protein